MDTDSLITLIKYVFALGFVIYFIMTMFEASEDPKASTDNYMNYLYPIIIGLIILIPSVFLSKDYANNMYYVSLIVGTVLVLFGCIFYYHSNVNNGVYSFINYLISGVLLLSILIGLAIIFYFYSNELKRTEGWLGFIVHLLFYVPCLILDFFNYLKQELLLTTNVVYYLFITEVLLILVYNYLPKVMEKIALKEGIPLMPGTAFLDIEKPIASNYDLRLKKQNDNMNSPIIYRNNYSLSMWMMLNQQSDNKLSYIKETSIFNYGDGKPSIKYVPKSHENQKDTLKIYFTNDTTDKNYFTIEIDVQKWNQIVFNYNTSYVDVFVNGHLEKTARFNNNHPTYSAEDIVTVGSTDGLDGAISNIKYYIGNQSKSQIANSYNLLLKKNPPTDI